MRSRWFGLVMAAVAVAMAVWAYPRLPPTMPTHFRFDGTPDGFSSRLEKPSGVPSKRKCVGMVGGNRGYAHTAMATATAAITRPNQRLRMLLSFPTKAGHEVAHDLLKDGRVQPVADELPFALGGDEVGRLEHAEVVRHRRERDRELLRDLARGEILGGQQLEDLATSRVGQSAKQRILHSRDIYTSI